MSRVDWDAASSVSGVVGKGHAGIGTRRTAWLAGVKQRLGHHSWRGWQGSCRDWDTANGVVGKGHAEIGTRQLAWLARVTQALGHGKWRGWQRARQIWDTGSGVSKTIVLILPVI